MKNLAFDASSKRRYDDNGFMHVESHITKEQVAPYYGREIPNWQSHGLDPDRVYYGYRPASELQKAAETFNGLPLLLHHHPESASAPQKEYRIGSVGSSARWNAPYLDNVLSITDSTGIQAVTDGHAREISSAYRYEPEFKSGAFDGEPYDFVMRNIRGNHVALVEKGRAGADVVVADAQTINPNKEKTLMSKLRDFFMGAFDGDTETDAPVTEDAASVRKAIAQLLPKVPEDKLGALVGAMKKLAGETEEKPAEDKAEKKPEADNKAEEKAEDKAEEKAEKKSEEKAGDKAEEKPEAKQEDKPEVEPMAKDAALAFDACGLDDDPEIRMAFAKGFESGMADAQTAKLAQDSAIEDAVKAIEAKYEAAEEVSPHIGSVKAMAFDSANDIYAHALSEMGIPAGMFSAESARDVFRIAVKVANKPMAQDSKPALFEGKFDGLNNIK